MAGFLDFKENDGNYKQENTPLPEGTYEMVVKAVEVRASKGSNHEYLNFDFVVRKDLDAVPELAKTNATQHGRHLFVSVWTLKDAQGNDTGKYDPRVLKFIANVAGVPPTNFKSQEDYMNALINKPIRTTVTIQENEYKGKKTKQNESTPIFFKKGEENPAYIGWYKTKYPLDPATVQAMTNKNPATTSFTDTTEINDNDLPF